VKEKSSEEVQYESLSRHPSLAGVSQAAFKKNAIKTYHSILSKLASLFGERDLNSLTPKKSSLSSQPSIKELNS
jgi:hypothetical protein